MVFRTDPCEARFVGQYIRRDERRARKIQKTSGQNARLKEEGIDSLFFRIFSRADRKAVAEKTSRTRFGRGKKLKRPGGIGEGECAGNGSGDELNRILRAGRKNPSLFPRNRRIVYEEITHNLELLIWDARCGARDKRAGVSCGDCASSSIRPEVIYKPCHSASLSMPDKQPHLVASRTFLQPLASVFTFQPNGFT